MPRTFKRKEKLSSFKIFQLIGYLTDKEFNIFLPAARFEYCPAKPLVPQEIFDGLDGLRKKLTDFNLHNKDVHPEFPIHIQEDMDVIISDVDEFIASAEELNNPDEPIGVV